MAEARRLLSLHKQIRSKSFSPDNGEELFCVIPGVLWAILAAASGWMAAISWVMQMLHYPAFPKVPPEEWEPFHRFHCGRVGVLVVPGMAIQTLGTAGAWVFSSLPFALAHSGLWLLSVGWTAAVTGPYHARIAQDPDPAQIEKMIRSGWVRTFAWTGQTLLALAQIAQG